MIKCIGISGYNDEMVITSTKKLMSSSSETDSKWAKQKREIFTTSDIPKLLVTQNHVYAAHLSSLTILDTKPFTDPIASITLEAKREAKIDKHSSAITCFGVEENALLLCSCSDEIVLLSKWDSLLGHWDSKEISEADGRILSCSITFKGVDVFITLFQTDVLLVYKVACAHSPLEPGPLILNSIECFITLEKVKELTTWSRSLFYKDNINVIGICSGNTVSVKLWEIRLGESEQNRIKLKSHRMVSYLKTISGADLVVEEDFVFVLVVGNDGVSEVFSLEDEGLQLLYRFKVDEPEQDFTKMIQSQMDSTPINVQVESRILCVKFFIVNFTKPVEDSSENKKNDDIPPDFGGSGDAKFNCELFSKLEDSEKESFIGNGSADDVGSTICPKLLLAVVTTRGTFLVDTISGQFEMSISHGDLLKNANVFVQNAEIAVNHKSNQIILALQSCLTNVVFTRRVKVAVESATNQPISSSEGSSLIPRETLSSKSVLRKKIKSPPRQIAVYPNIKGSSKVLSKSPAGLPSWARSRSRPQLKSSTCKIKMNPPMSARCKTFTGSDGSFQSIVGDLWASKAVLISGKGSYENGDIQFERSEQMVLPNVVPPNISQLRMSISNSGKNLALGGSFSPLVITRTQPFQNHRTFKDVNKVNSIHFNFEGNLLLLASGDCRTTLVDWRNSKELLAFDFATKFSEHIHAQFYFMDKFILQPEENKLVLYSYAPRDNGFIKLKAGEFQLPAQNITALNAANRFYSNMIVTGLSNKSIVIYDTNAERVSITIPNTHTKPISCIRINEAPAGLNATTLCDIFLTSTFSSFDPMKLWDVRSAKCIMRISDINQTAFVPTSRPNISPCGRYISSGFEDNAICFYDVRKIKNRLHTIRKIGSTVLDCSFDPRHPMIWSGCRNGTVLNFHIP